MGIRQRIVDMKEFARAMLAISDRFAERVRDFEAHFPVNDDTLAVMAQASYFCWFEAEYEQDYTEVCRAIGLGRPTSFYLCRQVTPRRWIDLHAYVVGVQRWLGVERRVPDEMDLAKVDQVIRWLEARSPQKEALAELYLCHLIIDHLLRLSLAKLGGSPDPDPICYSDFTAWYVGADGTAFTIENRDRQIERLKRQVFERMAEAPAQAGDLVTNILKPSQPPCQHRFTRYQDIKVTSIGALAWRGSVPPDTDIPKRKATEWFEQANLDGWLADRPPTTESGITLHAILGTPTEQKKAIVRDFFCGPPDGSFFGWLDDKANREGTTAAISFN